MSNVYMDEGCNTRNMTFESSLMWRALRVDHKLEQKLPMRILE